MVVFPERERSGPSFRLRLFDGVCLILAPVPVSAQSDTPSSRCLGVCFALAIFDFGDSRYVFDVDRAKYDDRFPP